MHIMPKGTPKGGGSDHLYSGETRAKLALGLCLLLSSGGVTNASENDSWTGPDKAKHVAVSVGLGVAARAVVDDNLTAFAIAMVPGVLKEVYDSQHRDRHTPSAKDLAANAVGAFIGVTLAHWGHLTIGPKWVRWTTTF